MVVVEGRKWFPSGGRAQHEEGAGGMRTGEEGAGAWGSAWQEEEEAAFAAGVYHCTTQAAAESCGTSRQYWRDQLTLQGQDQERSVFPAFLMYLSTTFPI